MSRLGKLPISIPAGTEVVLEKGAIRVKGGRGELREKLSPLVKVEILEEKEEEKQIKVSVNNPKNNQERALWGLFRSLIRNMVVGVNEGYEKKLEIKGVGYRAAVSGNKLILNLGFSHPVEYEIPAGIEIKAEGAVITVSGADKQLVGETAAQIRKIRKPEPYKGKGIRYSDEIIKKKAGKTAGKKE